MSTIDMTIRERIASEVLGEPVTDNMTMRCRFEVKHSKGNGARDMRVCLSNTGGKLPTFHCFHSSCEEDWRPLNRALRRGIWFAENGRRAPKDSPWNQGRRMPAEPRAEAPARRDYDEAALRRLLRPGFAPDRAWFASRSPIAPATVTSEAFLAHLYEPEERVVVFTEFASQGQYLEWIGHGSYRLAPRPDVRAVKSPDGLPAGGPEGVWFMCQPVTGLWYANPRNPREDGTLKMSRRSMEAVTAWRYMVLESDSAPEDLWLNMLAQLPLPIAAIYDSGGRSIHALIRVDARSKTEWDAIKRTFVGLLTKLGGDAGALSAVRLTRLPGCLRGKRKQALIYLNPRPLLSGGAIAAI